MLYTASMAAANVLAGVLASVLMRWVVPVRRGDYVLNHRPLIYGSALGYLAAGAIVSVLAALLMLAPVARWYRRGGPPTDTEQSAVMLLPLRQSLVHTIVWLIGAIAFTAYHYGHSPDFAITGGIVIMLVSIGTFGASYLVGERILRPVAARVLSDAEYAPLYAPPISVRLLLSWSLGTLLPIIGVLTLSVAHSEGWIHTTETAFVGAIIVMVTLTGCASLTLTAITGAHLSGPVRQLRAALGDLREGVAGRRVSVYDGSELGTLQVGFNRMVDAVEERQHLRNVFGKHVGVDVARQALETGTRLGGEMRFVAVLFVDMIASTRLATDRSPTEVVEVLNRFFRVVIEVVHAGEGFINKFIGDEVFVVFGAPLVRDDPCTSALRTAREIHSELVRRTDVDVGIGVSSGECVAGNVGASERLEYTVIGDAVNEAARLTERAKLHPSRISASAQTVRAAAADEQEHWLIGGSLVLRGRGQPTDIAHPLDSPDDDGPDTAPRYRPPPD